MVGFLIRIFGTKDCERCQSIVKAFEYHGFPFEYIDADAPENEELCDKYHVDELPHVQAMYDDNSKVFYTHIGYISPILFIEKAQEHTKQLEEFFNANLEAASKNIDIERIKRQANESRPRPKPCAGCKKNLS
jgi:glutaredoxin